MADTFTETPKKPKAEARAKVNLNDRVLKSLRPGDRPFEVMDSQVRGFGIRIMPTGVKTFILRRRYPGSTQPARRSLGSYGEMSLAEAREKAAQWNALVKKGIDPGAEEARQRKATLEAERNRKLNTFGSAFDDYLRRKASKLRSFRTIERELRRECAAWMDKPLSSISPIDVKQLVQDIAESGREAQAYAIFSRLRAFLNYVIDSGDFDLEVSPCEKLKPTVLIGRQNVRQHVLKDHEIAALWRASEQVGYPFGKFYQLLLLTALRRDEVAEAQWSEIDFKAKLWVVPGSRMKNAAPHAVPLVPKVLSLLESIPRFTSGDYLFSTTDGEKPVSGFSKAKRRLDALMRADLEAQGLQFEHFVTHDIRRTCRTRFSALPAEDIVRELLMAHARPGLHKVYDLHAYEKEKADLLKLWHAKLKSMIDEATGTLWKETPEGSQRPTLWRKMSRPGFG